jgi:DNA-binding CsgD family transcriptional regulator
MPQHPDFPPQHHEVIVETETTTLSSIPSGVYETDNQATSLPPEHETSDADTISELRQVIVEEALLVAGLQLVLQKQRSGSSTSIVPPSVRLTDRQQHLLGNVLPRLSSFERQVVVLVHCFKRSPRMVATILECSTDEVKSTLSNAQGLAAPPAASRPVSGTSRILRKADQEMVLSSRPPRSISWQNPGSKESSIAGNIIPVGLQLGSGKIAIARLPGRAASTQDKCGYLAAIGFSNREVAAFLCISKPMVTKHLKKLFEKRSITSRTQLAESYIADGTFRPIPDAAYLRLSSVEEAVVDYVRRGMENSQIAQEMFLSVHTVKTHVKRILERHQFTRREHIALAAQLVRAAYTTD